MHNFAPHKPPTTRRGRFPKTRIIAAAALLAGAGLAVAVVVQSAPPTAPAHVADVPMPDISSTQCLAFQDDALPYVVVILNWDDTSQYWLETYAEDVTNLVHDLREIPNPTRFMRELAAV